MKEENQEGLYTRVINIDEGRGAALNRSLNNLENKTPKPPSAPRRQSSSFPRQSMLGSKSRQDEALNTGITPALDNKKHRASLKYNSMIKTRKRPAHETEIVDKRKFQDKNISFLLEIKSACRQTDLKNSRESQLRSHNKGKSFKRSFKKNKTKQKCSLKDKHRPEGQKVLRNPLNWVWWFIS